MLHSTEEQLRSALEAECRFSEQLMSLSEVSNRLSKAASLDDLCRTAVELGRTQLGFDRVGLWFVEQGQTAAKGSFGVDENGQLRDERDSRVTVTPSSLAGQVLSSKRPFALQSHGPVLDDQGQVVGQGSHAIASLWDGEEVIGFMSADTLLTRRPITERDCKLLIYYASVLGHLCSLKRAEEGLRASERRSRQLEEELRRRAGALARADHAKDQFLAMLAHELRNPLAPILNAVQLLKLMGAADPGVIRAQEIIERQVNHQARLLDDLLNVSRIARGKIELRLERLDLVQLVRDTTEAYREVLAAAGLILSVELPEPPVWMDADPTRLAQVLGNLLQNAVKFTDAGGQVTVGLRIADCGLPPRSAILTVRDTGIGIAPEMLPHLFEAFSQADGSLDRTEGGLGLGLSLVKGLVELHAGEVRAESAGTGCGSEFTLSLPTSSAPDAAAAPHDPTVSPGRALNILVVEDNRDAAEALTEILVFHGHRVEIAYSGADAVAAARRFRPEVILCDLGLPGMDGYEVARALRGDPSTAAARLIAISGYGQEEDRRRSREAGFDAHLTKPVDFRELQKLLEAGGEAGAAL